DVTTTMLWIGGQITAQQVVVELFLPSLVCLLVPLAILSLRLKGEAPRPRLRAHVAEGGHATTDRERNAVLAMGIGALLFVPVFKTVTGLPPYMGILFGLGVLWVATEIMHRDKKPELKHPLSVIGVLHRVIHRAFCSSSVFCWQYPAWQRRATWARSLWHCAMAWAISLPSTMPSACSPPWWTTCHWWPVP